tara:strand:+ start:530 stop:3364 length:2835 start_codon:yes stop_codon:yes gene_type:complete
MLSVPDIGHVYPKTGVYADLRFDTAPSFVSSGSCLFSSTYLEADGIQISSASDWSVACWVRSSPSATGTYQYLIDVSKASSQRVILYLGSNGDFGHWGTGDSSPTEFGDATVIRDGTWHHVCFTVSGGTSAKVYVDGELNGSATITSQDLSASSGTCDIGGTTSSSYLFDNGSGSLCHLGFWNAELTQAEIRSLMTATTYAEAVSQSGNTPAHYWVFESDLNASVGGVNADASSGGAAIVGDRARLPNGLDLSGNRRDARLHSGRCLSFDGSADHVDGASYSDSSNYFTLSLWVEQESAAAGRGIFTNGPDAADVEHGLLYTTGSGELRWYFQDGTAKQYVEADTSLQPDTFHHIVITVDGSDSSSFDICMYLDGKLQDKAKAAGGFSLADKLALGCEFHASNGANLFWFGAIADVKIFNVELTAAQALELYSNPEQILPTGVSSSALKRWYPCNDFDVSGANNLEGMFLQDCSGNNNPLEIHNSAMEFSRPDIPQLALRSSGSLVLFGGGSSGDYLQSSDTSLSTAAFSFSAWVCAFSSAGSYPSIISAHDGSSNDYDNGITIDLGSSSQTAVEYINIEGVGVSGATDLWSGSIAFGQWFHIVVTSTTSEYKLYINGSDTSCTTRSRSDTSANDLNIVRIGARYYSSSVQAASQFDGLITDVGLWNAALDADSVAAIHTAGRGADIRSDIGNYDQSSALQHLWRTDNPVTCSDLEGSDDMTVNGAPSMATAIEDLPGSSVFGGITTKTVGSSKANFPFMQNVNSTQLQGYLEHKCPTWGTGEYCVAFWLRTTHLSGGATHYFWDIRGSTNSYGMRIYASGNNNILWKPKGAGSGEVAIYPAPSSGTVTDGAWHFVALQRLGATSQKWHWRRITDASFNTGTNSTGFGDMTDAGTAYINGSSSATSPSGGQMAMPRLYIGKSFSDNEIGNMFEQGKRILLGDTL